MQKMHLDLYLHINTELTMEVYSLIYLNYIYPRDTQDVSLNCTKYPFEMLVFLIFLYVFKIYSSTKIKGVLEDELSTLNSKPGILPDRTNRIEDIYLRLYNGKTSEEYVDFPLLQGTRLFEIKGFDNDNPTVLYVHGFIETAQHESVLVMVNAYLETRPDTNVILLDWSNMSHGSYLVNAARNTKKVGVAAAEIINILIEKGLALEKLHLIGHSLGSHVVGYLARELKNTYNKTVKRVTALDPAFPAFYPDGVMMEHISQKDAEFVDVIHTDAGGYGAPVRTGTVDFWPNGGKRVQPGCPRFAPIPLSEENLCSHCRSWRFYAESVRNPENFPASPADTYTKFRENPSPEVGMVYMGANCSTSAQGSYYLTTNAESPFGKGIDGIYSKNKNTKRK